MVSYFLRQVCTMRGGATRTGNGVSEIHDRSETPEHLFVDP